MINSTILRNTKAKLLILLMTTAGLAACGSGSGSSDTPAAPGGGGAPSPVTPEPEEEFLTVEMSSEFQAEKDTVKRLSLSLNESNQQGEDLVYFRWQKNDGSEVPSGSIRPVAGVIHLSKFDDEFPFEVQAKDGFEGEYTLIFTLENGQKLEHEIMMTVQ